MPYVMQNKQKEPAYCCRRVMIFPEGIWLISDDLRMAGKQESTMYFHLAPEVIVKEQKEREVLLENEDVRLILGAEYPLEQRKEIFVYFASHTASLHSGSPQSFCSNYSDCLQNMRNSRNRPALPSGSL